LVGNEGSDASFKIASDLLSLAGVTLSPRVLMFRGALSGAGVVCARVEDFVAELIADFVALLAALLALLPIFSDQEEADPMQANAGLSSFHPRSGQNVIQRQRASKR
jgi:hypothetical protein